MSDMITAILMGHLRLPVTSVKRALLELDDNILTSEILKQLLTYAPDPAEVSIVRDWY